MQTKAGSLKTLSLASLFAVVVAATPVFAIGPTEITLEDFESGTTAGAIPVDTSNSSASGASQSTLENVMETASKRLKISDGDGA